MKPIQKDELYEHLRGFLVAKGIELKQGSYSQTIQKSCSILADAINLSQRGIEKAKTGLDQQLDKMRQVIHEKTAPKPPPANPAASPGSTTSNAHRDPANAPAASKTRRAKAAAKKSAAKKRPSRGAKPH